MDKVKSTISEFTSKVGHKDTTVHETVAPGVVHEQIKPHEHEEVITAVDKEVHQDHYHRTVQPVKDREILPEQHKANIEAVQQREIDHRNHEKTKAELAAEQTRFRDERKIESTSHSQTAAPTVGGEHVHHHVHETIQPIVEKETIQPNVVHTTVPIHETHHNAAKHHATSELPAVSMNEFKQKGGVLGGREERYDGFEGEPKHIGGLKGAVSGAVHHKRDTQDAETTLKHSGNHGELDPIDGRSSGLIGSNHNTAGSGLTGSNHNTASSGLTGSNHNTAGSGLTGSNHNTAGSGLTGSHHNASSGLNTGANQTSGLTGSTRNTGSSLTDHTPTTRTNF